MPENNAVKKKKSRTALGLRSLSQGTRVAREDVFLKQSSCYFEGLIHRSYLGCLKIEFIKDF